MGNNCINDLARDLITDIRCARRDGLVEYEKTCRRQLTILLDEKYSKGAVAVDQYGWPVSFKEV